MTTEENKLEILRKVEDGSLTIQEGADLIGILENAKPDIEPDQSGSLPPFQSTNTINTNGKHEVSGFWKAVWSIFLVGGAILAGFSAFWIYQGYTNHGFSWGFWLSWIPMAIGIGLMFFGWALMESPWMHIKIHSTEEGRDHKFVFNMPVPFNIARWVMERFGQYMPEEAKSKDILAMLDLAENSVKNGEPFQVQVDDEEDDTKVDIFIN